MHKNKNSGYLCHELYNSGFIVLSSIRHELIFIKVLERFGIIELYINARDINLSPFNASQ